MNEARQHCGTVLRRQRVRDSSAVADNGLEINGIDFVEVLDRQAPPDRRDSAPGLQAACCGYGATPRQEPASRLDAPSGSPQ